MGKVSKGQPAGEGREQGESSISDNEAELGSNDRSMETAGLWMAGKTHTYAQPISSELGQYTQISVHCLAD